MKRSLLIAVCLALTASTVVAQLPGSIGLFADKDATNCAVYDLPELIIVYAIHVYTPGATGAQFMVDHMSWGASLTYLSEISPYPSVIGNSQTGITISYDGCLSSPNLILRINFLGSGLSAPCSYIQVVPDPGAVPPGIYVTDCASPVPNLLTATGGDVVVNPDASCMCDIPVQETTWGQVKALYR